MVMKMSGEATKFVFWTTQRSGSTFIRLWLNNHPNIRCHSEIFLQKYRGEDGFRAYCEANIFRRLFYNYLDRYRFNRFKHNFVVKQILERFLDELFNNPSFSAPWTDYDAAKEYQPRGNPEMEKAAGFQLMYSQISHYRFLQQWITDQNVRIIHLFRQNVLRTYFSSIKAKQTGQFHVSNKTISQQKILINPKTIIDDLSRLINRQEISKNRFPNNPYLEFTYEQFFSDHYQNITEEIFSFLEIEKAEVEFPTWLKKLNPGPLEELIENYSEIAMILQGTPYQKFLDNREGDGSII
jgi:LPS sulfotransferase NodH